MLQMRELLGASLDAAIGVKKPDWAAQEASIAAEEAQRRAKKELAIAEEALRKQEREREEREREAAVRAKKEVRQPPSIQHILHN